MIKKIETHCIRQNCFLHEYSMEHDCRFARQGKTYIELQNKVVPDGIKQEYVEVEYPHTAERVNSYAEAADYRRDPFAAIAKSQPRENLGNIIDLQKLANMDTSARKAYIDSLSAAVETLKKSTAVAPDVTSDEKSQSEVKPNE